jgi:hypothetical protein
LRLLFSVIVQQIQTSDRDNCNLKEDTTSSHKEEGSKTAEEIFWVRNGEDRDGITVQTHDYMGILSNQPKEIEGSNEGEVDQEMGEEQRSGYIQSTVRIRVSITVC